MTNKVIKGLRGNSKGVSAIEVIIALAILGIIAVTFLAGLSTAFKADIIADERSVAQSLAQSQMEHVKSQGYSSVNAWSYALTASTRTFWTKPSWWQETPEVPPKLSSDYAGYCAKVEAGQVDEGTPEEEGIRKITVTTYHNEDCAQDEVLKLEDYKIRRD